eukprot:TRINITY_DN16569_c0_g1_i1.p1 TRINITY_DN16569_c0_g1~~TRINITY_DN16569_c0_g1_i1.p1  ORF type:complete len:391 (+),score=164.17 TRINITY_DN16569_c0_g1_i1:62-1234(+)
MDDEYGLENDQPTQEEEGRQHEAATTIQRYWRSKSAHRGDQTDLDDEDPHECDELRKENLLRDYVKELERRDNLLKENMAMQRTLSKHFEQKKQGDQEKPQEQHSAAEGENKYLIQLDQLRSARLKVEQLRESNYRDQEEAKKRMQVHLEKADDYDRRFRMVKRERAERAVFTRNNKEIGQIPAMRRRLDQYEQEEREKSGQVTSARVAYIKMRNRQKKLADLLKEKEKLTDGLHLIDFEQLKIENTTLNEKIEERNEDLLKLKKKATTTIHILTHVKEKLQFIQGENAALRKQLEALDTTLDEHRSQMTAVKRDRDLFVSENVKMREKMPMIGSEDLLMDYEIRKKQIENLRIEVVEKTNRHHELMQWITKWQPVSQQRQLALRKARTA